MKVVSEETDVHQSLRRMRTKVFSIFGGLKLTIIGSGEGTDVFRSLPDVYEEDIPYEIL